MSLRPKSQSIEIIWEHIVDDDSGPLFQRAVKLILAEIDRDLASDEFDRQGESNHAGGVPSRTNKSKQIEQ